jgi:cell division protein FtsQ
MRAPVSGGRVLRPGVVRPLLALATLLAGSAGFAVGVAGPERWLPRLAPECCVVRSLGVRGAVRVAPAEIARASVVAAGTPLASVDPGAVAARVARHPWIAEARAASVAPDRLVVSVVEREPAAVVHLAGEDWLVDSGGTPFVPVAGEAGSGLPRLAGAEDAAPGHADGRLAEGIAIARALRARGLPEARQVGLADAHPGVAPTLRLAEPTGSVLLGAGELDAKLVRLAALLDAQLPEVATATSIDLRFGDRLVLRSEGSPDGDAAATRGGAAPPERGGGPEGPAGAARVP